MNWPGASDTSEARGRADQAQMASDPAISVTDAAFSHTVLESSADAVVVTEATGLIVLLNHQAELLFGYARSALIGQPVEQLIPARFHATHVRYRARYVTKPRTRAMGAGLQIFGRRQDGSEVPIEVNLFPFRIGEELQVIATIQDISERLRLDHQRSALLQVVYHDLAAPVTAMRMYLDSQQRRLEQGQPSHAPDAKSLATMNYALDRAEHLLADLRTLVSLEAGQLPLDLQLCDLSALCEREVEAERLVAEREIRLVEPATAALVRADPDKLGQVLANLLTNAVKYAPPERPITVTLRRERSAASASGQRARVLVHDEGPGIAREEQRRIWEPFQRALGIQAQPGTGGSLGLGLYICREIVKRHGGTIGVRGAPGQGSTFWFALPLVAT